MPSPQDISAFPNLRDLGEILLEIFDAKYAAYDPIYPKYFNIENGERFTETILGLIPVNQMEQVSFGQSTPFTDVLEGYKTQISAQKWARGIQFTEEAVKFDRSGRLRRMPDRLARSANYASEVEAARILNEATTTNHADTGKPLVSTTQPIKRTGGTFSNSVSGDISVAVLDSAFVQFAKFVDDNNELINTMPKYLIHTPDDGRVARQLLGSNLEPYTADNQANDFRGRVQAIQNPFLTDADNAFMVAEASENGLYYLNWGQKVKAWIDNDADVLKFKVNKIMKATFQDFHGLVGIVGV